jgi:hypothetical protein
MFRKKVRLTIGLTLVGLLLAGLAAARVVTQRPATNSAKQEAKRQGNKQEEPTPVQEGVMTEKQKKHSKLFKGYGRVTKGKKLRELVAETGEVNISVLVGDKRLPRTFDLNQHIRQMVCEADAVLIGEVKARESQIIEEGTFVFSDYEVTVAEVIKDNSSASIQTASDITVTRIGGSVTLDGHKVKTLDHSQRPLNVGERYLFFLKFDAGSSSYRSLRIDISEDTFRLSANRVNQVSALPLPFGSKDADADTFISDVHRALAMK